MESSSRHALDSKEIHELESFQFFSQDSNIDIFDCIHPDSKISRPDLRDNCNKSDNGQVSENVCGGGCSSGYDDKDDNEQWALWDKNNHDFYMIRFWASSG